MNLAVSLADTSAILGAHAGAVVEKFLRIIMIPDAASARAGRPMSDAGESSAFDADRYAWIKKRFEPTDGVAGATAQEAVVYNIGTLFGACPDGKPFEGNRWVDRYLVRLK